MICVIFEAENEQAYDLVANKYPGYMSIDDQLKASDCQIAKKSYHDHKGFGLDFDKYDNITKDNLVTLQNTKGNMFEKVDDYNLKSLLKTFKKKIYDFSPVVMYVNKETRQIITFNQTSGDLITAEKYRKNYLNILISVLNLVKIGNPGN